MEHKPGISFSHTADYSYIDSALKSRWEPFCELEKEFKSFVPKTAAAFSGYRESELIRLKKLNPEASDNELLHLIDGQIRGNSQPGVQISYRFSDRVMAEYVTVAFLAHALAESAINAILAIGLATSGTAELFSLLERADIKEKWTTGPKAFHPPYTLPKSSALFDTLQHLTRQRNAFVHHKIELEMDGEIKIKGSRLDRAPLDTQLNWIKRFFSLPYDLANHAQKQAPAFLGFILHDSTPIQRFTAHASI